MLAVYNNNSAASTVCFISATSAFEITLKCEGRKTTNHRSSHCWRTILKTKGCFSFLPFNYRCSYCTQQVLFVSVPSCRQPFFLLSLLYMFTIGRAFYCNFSFLILSFTSQIQSHHHVECDPPFRCSLTGSTPRHSTWPCTGSARRARRTCG